MWKCQQWLIPEVFKEDRAKILENSNMDSEEG